MAVHFYTEHAFQAPLRVSAGPGAVSQISEHLAYYTRQQATMAALPGPSAQAAPDDQAAVATPEGSPYLTFSLGGLRWGLALTYLREVLPSAPTITPLPFSPLWLRGLMNLRGDAIGVVHLAEVLLDPVFAADAAARRDLGAPVLVTESDGISLALQVQELGEIVYLPQRALHKLSAAEIRTLPTFAISHLQAAWMPPSGAPPVLLLDLPPLIASLLTYLTAREAPGDG